MCGSASIRMRAWSCGATVIDGSRCFEAFLAGQGDTRKGLGERRSQHLCPLPLWERATQKCNEEEWVRGHGLTPHPFAIVGPSAMPSPTRGEGAATRIAPAATKNATR